MIHPKKNLTDKKALSLYRNLLLPRQIEERMLKLLRQNKISKWFSGIGQEAIGVGAAQVLADQDFMLPMHRNLGVFTTRGVPFYPLFCQLFGKTDGFSAGRERSFHFGTLDYNIVGMISHLAATMPVADGLALASKMKDDDAVALSFCGDGATSEGDFHEALNLAAVWELPVIFMIENNGYGLSTPVNEQYACENLVDKAVGYGIEGVQIDGNDIFAVREAVADARSHVLDTHQPVMIEALTFRMRGHEEASGTFYVPDEKFDEWAEKDPIKRVEDWLKSEKIIETDEQFETERRHVDEQFEDDLQRALGADDPTFNSEREEQSVWAPVDWPDNLTVGGSNGTSEERRFIDGLRHALSQAFDEDDRFLIMGQDIAEYGGVFKVTEGFLDRYGPDRVRNTPIIESGAIGAALGLALAGFKPVVEMQFSDFITCGFNQLVNNVAKGHYRWMPPLNITIRAPHGAGVGAGPFHSQSPEGWFMQHPGLKVVVPGTVEDAQNLLYSALFDPNPVLVFEHKKLYRSQRAEVPTKCRLEPLGKTRIHREGHDATIVTYGMGVRWADEMADEYAEKGIELEIVDLRTLAPLDMETVRTSVAKTNKVLLLQEPSRTLGPMSELSARVTEECFEALDAPVLRCSSLDTPVPTNHVLEEGYLASYRLKETLDRLLRY